MSNLTKYVVRDGPISDCDSGLIGALQGAGGPYDANDDCGPGSLPVGAPGVYSMFNDCCNANPKADNCLEACAECPERVESSGGKFCGGGTSGFACANPSPAITYTVNGQSHSVTCCSGDNENTPCQYTGDRETAIMVCNYVDELANECNHMPGVNRADIGCEIGKYILIPSDRMAGPGGDVHVVVDKTLLDLVNCQGAVAKSREDGVMCGVDVLSYKGYNCAPAPGPPPKKCTIKHCENCSEDGKYCFKCKKGTKLDWQGKRCCTPAEIAAGTCSLTKPKPKPSPGPGPVPYGATTGSGAISTGGWIGIVAGSIVGVVALLFLIRHLMMKKK